MIPSDPFVLLIIYLILAAGAVWALNWLLRESKVPYPWNIAIPVIIGLLLLLLAFRMAGIPLFS